MSWYLDDMDLHGVAQVRCKSSIAAVGIKAGDTYAVIWRDCGLKTTTTSFPASG